MPDSGKSKAQLITELEEARQRIAELTDKKNGAAHPGSASSDSPKASSTASEGINYELLLDHSPVCHKIVDLDLNLQYMNASGFKMLEVINPAGHYGKPYPFDFFPQESCRRLRAELHKVIQTQAASSLEGSYRTATGKEVWLHHQIVPVKHDDGSLASLAVVTSDITQRKRTEEKLSESLLRQNEAVKAGRVGFWDWNLITDTVSYSSEWKRQVGCEDDEIGDDLSEWGDRVHPDDLDSTMAFVKGHIEGVSDGYEVEFRFRHKSGDYLWILVQASIFRSEDGMAYRVLGSHIDITEQKRIQEALSKSEALLNETGSIARVGGWELDARTMEVSWTEETYRIHEVPLDIKPPLEEAISFYHEEDRPILKAALQEAMDNATPFDLELRFITAKGNRLWTRAICQPQVVDGQVLKLQGVFQDITERKQSEDRLRLVLDAISDGVWDLNLKTGEEYHSPLYARRLGYEPEEIDSSRQGWIDMLHPEDREGAVSRENAFLAGESELFQSEFRMRRKDGEYIWVMSRARVVERDENGVPQRVVGAHLDITERKAAEQALLESEQRLALATESAGIGTWVWDIITDEMTWDERIFRLYGIPEIPEHYGLEYWQSCLHPDDREPTGEACLAAVRGEKDYDVEFRVQWPDGTVRWMKGDGIVIRDEDGKPIRMLGTNYDITDRKMAEYDLLKAKEKAEAANKAKSEFLANMSHEIRTPLNGLMGMLQLLKTTRQDANQDEYTNQALQSSRRLLQLLTDILDLARVEAGKMNIAWEATDLRDVVDDTVQLFMPVAMEKRLGLHVCVNPVIPSSVKGDGARLQQVLSNLVGNALKFTDVGHVQIDVHPLPPREDGEYRVLFAISDTGIGMTGETMDMLFNPFTQAEQNYVRKYQGAGLGLSISKRLVELMGGSMAVESEEEIGTTLYFCVPFLATQSSPSDSPAVDLQPWLQGLDILVVEDDETSMFIAREHLKREGHQTEAASDGKQALEMMQKRSFDLVLMDVQMPVLDGVETTVAIRQGEVGDRNRDIPIIAMTAYAMVGDKDKFLGAGMDGYVSKPVDINQLRKVIIQVLDGGGKRA